MGYWEAQFNIGKIDLSSAVSTYGLIVNCGSTVE